MTEWAFILAPLLVLPIVLLFHFVGCGFSGVATGEAPIELPERAPVNPPAPPTPPPTEIHLDNNPPDYRKYILGEQPNPGLVTANPEVVPNGADVIAYWRMVDLATSQKAKDEKGVHNGDYKAGYILPAVAGSMGKNPAQFVTGQASLIDSDPAAMCRKFDGGHVLVPFKAQPAPPLYTDQFTIEAWIAAEAFDLDFEYVLFDAGGTYALPPSPQVARGFRVFVNLKKGWQVQLGPGNTDLFAVAPMVPIGPRTHVALTVGDAVPGGVQKKVTLYLDGKPFGPVNVPSYNRPDGAPLFIGIENQEPNPGNAVRLRHPVLCRIQEVVLHKKALSLKEIQNHVDINRKKI